MLNPRQSLNLARQQSGKIYFLFYYPLKKAIYFLYIIYYFLLKMKDNYIYFQDRKKIFIQYKTV